MISVISQLRVEFVGRGVPLKAGLASPFKATCRRRNAPAYAKPALRRASVGRAGRLKSPYLARLRNYCFPSISVFQAEKKVQKGTADPGGRLTN